MKIYLIQFLAYTMAMVGFFALCVYIYKKFCLQNYSSKSQDCLCIENALRINPKKQILVVRAGNERFLIASDAETTTMLAKLEDNLENTNKVTHIKKVLSESNPVPIKKSFDDRLPIMKRIKEKMKA